MEDFDSLLFILEGDVLGDDSTIEVDNVVLVDSHVDTLQSQEDILLVAEQGEVLVYVVGGHQVCAFGVGVSGVLIQMVVEGQDME